MLKILDLQVNEVDNLPQNIGDCMNLVELHLNANAIPEVPVEIGNLTEMRAIYGYSNRLDALPLSLGDLSEITACNLSWNALTFEDIEPLVSINGFNYSTQDSIGDPLDTTIVLNSPFRLECLTGGEFNLYLWLKDEDTLAGETDYFIEFPSVTFSDSGSYRCEVSNSIATELILFSKPCHMHVKDFTQISDADSKDDMQIEAYPNPFTSEIYFRNQDLIEIPLYVKIYDSQGRVTLSEHPETNYINTVSLKPGIYIIELVNHRNSRVYKKMMKQPR